MYLNLIFNVLKIYMILLFVGCFKKENFEIGRLFYYYWVGFLGVYYWFFIFVVYEVVFDGYYVDVI